MNKFLSLLATICLFAAPAFAQFNGGGGSGTVTSIATSCSVSGGTITTMGTISATLPVDAQTGTTITPTATADCGHVVTESNASAIAVSLVAANWSTTSNFFGFKVLPGSTGSATLTPTTGTIDGAASVVFAPGQGGTVWFDGTNWFTVGRYVSGPSSSTNNDCAKFSGTNGQVLADSGAPCGSGQNTGYVSGVSYPATQAASLASSVAGVANTTYCAPFTTLSPAAGGTFTVTALGGRVATASTGNSSLALSVAIYNNDPSVKNRPGAIVGTTASFVNLATGTLNTTVSTNLGTPITLNYNAEYWFCMQTFDTTVTYTAVANTNNTIVAQYIGSTTIGNIYGNPISGVSIAAGTFGTWPSTLNGSTFADIAASSHAPAGLFTVQ